LKQLAPTAMPPTPAPMLCTLIAEPFDNASWIFEPKYDGLHILGRYDGKDLVLLSRNRAAQNFQFPDVASALEDSLTRPAIVDGEIVCFDEHGRSSFRSLQQRFHLKDAREVDTRMRRYAAYLYLFDLLYVDEYDITSLPLRLRKTLLRQSVKWSERVLWTPYEREKGRTLWRRACREGSECIVGKHLDSPYVQSRSSWWVKVKCIGRQEFVIGGFTEPQRSRVGLGALRVGYYSDDGQRFLYAGKVGTGYTQEVALDLRKRFEKVKQRPSPFDQGASARDGLVHWVQPKLVAEIAFAEWTQNGLLRQPRFEGLRPDKRPTECRREQPKTRVDAGSPEHTSNQRPARPPLEIQPCPLKRTDPSASSARPPSQPPNQERLTASRSSSSRSTTPRGSITIIA
jgi:bifunctional non-homologous end joining protein LigD